MLVMNDTRKAVLKALENADENGMTLAEVAAATGLDVKTGTTNAMVTANLIKKVGTRTVERVVKVEVATYALGDKTVAELEAEAKAAKEAKAKAKAAKAE